MSMTCKAISGCPYISILRWRPHRVPERLVDVKAAAAAAPPRTAAATPPTAATAGVRQRAAHQRLTLVHYLAHRKHILWDMLGA